MEPSFVIPRRKLSHEVLEHLLTRIRSGEFAPGEQLPSERELMQAYGVGRPAVREALQSLERAGILSITHGERARIVVPTADALIGQIASGARHILHVQPHTLEHLKDARLFLEVGLARRAAERASESAIEALEAAHADLVRALSTPDSFLSRDMAFHREIARATENPIFPAIVEAMFGWLGEFYSHLVRAPGAENLTIEEHARILEAIKARDPPAAGQAMHDHLTRANSLYRRFERG